MAAQAGFLEVAIMEIAQACVLADHCLLIRDIKDIKYAGNTCCVLGDHASILQFVFKYL
jgi:hypothetical protein